MLNNIQHLPNGDFRVVPQGCVLCECGIHDKPRGAKHCVVCSDNQPKGHVVVADVAFVVAGLGYLVGKAML